MEIVHVPERLALGRIGEMNLDERPLNAEQRVAQGDARVGKPTGVDDGGVEVPLVQPIDECPLVVGLEEVHIQPELGGSSLDSIVDLDERLATVDFRLAGSDEIEVRTLKDEHPGPPAAPRTA